MAESHEERRIYRILRDEDFKLTRQRRIIVATLLRHEKEHLSAEELYQFVREQDPEVGLATVYRTLELLERLDLVRGISFGDGRIRYEFTGEVHHHHHVVCVSCDQIQEVDADLLGAVEAEVTRRLGYSIVDHELKLYGLCPTCQEDLQEEAEEEAE